MLHLICTCHYSQVLIVPFHRSRAGVEDDIDVVRSDAHVTWSPYPGLPCRR